MKLTECLDRLEQLIIDRASVAEQRNIITAMREQCEAHDQEASDHAKLKAEHLALKNSQRDKGSYTGGGLPKNFFE